MDILFPFVGGLGLFLYGMNEMSKGLQRIAGYRLKGLLHTLTANRFLGMLSGFIVTAIVQSSSVTTVMLVGFVNAGLIALPQAISVILGAHIGTTITVQIIAFKIEAMSLPLLALGAVLHLFSKSELLKNLGGILFGAGGIFYGLSLMVTAFHPLQDNPTLSHLFVLFAEYPLLGFAIGMVLTILVQSSTVTTGITIALSLASLISFEQAVPLIVGENVGTTITANIAAIGGSFAAKQAARAHFMINMTGALLALLFLAPFMKLVLAFSPADSARQIANAHTLFNILTTLLFLPLIGITARLTSFLVAGKKEDSELAFLDETAFEEPGTALDQVKRGLRENNEIAYRYLHILSKAIPSRNEKTLPDMRLLKEKLERYRSRITEYLEKIPLKNLSRAESRQIAAFVRIIHEIERTHDYEEKMKEVMTDMITEGRMFSFAERKTLTFYFRKVLHIMERTNHFFNQENYMREINRIAGEYEKIYEEKKHLRKVNRRQVTQGKTAIAIANYYDDIVTSLEEIGKKCRNIAQALVE